MLVAQMVSVHVMAMRCAHHLASAEDIAQLDSAGRALGRLARTFPPRSRRSAAIATKASCHHRAERVDRRTGGKASSATSRSTPA